MLFKLAGPGHTPQNLISPPLLSILSPQSYSLPAPGRFERNTVKREKILDNSRGMKIRESFGATFFFSSIGRGKTVTRI